MNIPELLIGLFGGGAMAQLAATFINARANRRHIHAEAYGTEVEGIERTIMLLRNSLEAEVKAHAEEREMLRNEIRSLDERITELNNSIVALRVENAQLRASLNISQDME